MDTTENIQQTKIRKLWQRPWGYAEGFFIALIFLCIGFIFDLISSIKGKGVLLTLLFKNEGVTMPQFPLNLIILLILINALFITWIFFKNNSVIRWLSTVPAAISAITLFTFLVLLLGFAPQSERYVDSILYRLGILHMTTSYTFLLAQLYFFTSLGLVIMRRVTPFSFKNIGFILNHAGLWLTIASAALGSGDLKRLTMKLEQGSSKFNNVAYDANNNAYALKVTMKLLKFEMEEYPPKLVLFDIKNNKVILEGGKKYNEATKGLKVKFMDWDVEVLEYYPLATHKDSNFISNETMGAAPAAQVKVINRKTNKIQKAWISTGSFIIPPQPLKLNDNYGLIMSSQQPKRFTSKVEFYTKELLHDSIILEVNKPVKIREWKIYQSGYNSELGRWSNYSEIEFVNDPWLPMVYFGIFMLMAGALYMFWVGRNVKE